MKRHLRFAFCQKHQKRRYHSRKDARWAIRVHRASKSLREYRCDELEGWHVGHLPQATKFGVKTADEVYTEKYRRDRKATMGTVNSTYTSSRVYYDFEFLEDGKTIDWISAGFVFDSGQSLYVVNRALCFKYSVEHQRVTRHPWLMENVVPHLPLMAPVRPEGDWRLDHTHQAVCETDEAAERIRNFIGEVSDPQLWAWYGAYDHVRLAQMWGPMKEMPPGIPWHTNDIMTLRTLGSPSARTTEPKQAGPAHDALADAWHNRRLWHHYMGAMKLRGYEPDE